MIKISAIVCTYKRPEYLRHALRSLCEQALDRDQYEIIVVDNAVEAEAERIVQEFQTCGTNLKYIAESKVGLSHARNRGLKEALGEYVAFMDDDARADDRWLETLLKAFESSSRPAAIGGRVWLDWQGKRPAWVPDDQLSVFTYVDHGEEGHVLRADEYLVGANMAFQKDILNSIGGFDTNLGRQGAVLLSGEEARVVQQLVERGCEVYYEPHAVVWHSVDPSRRRPTWLLRRMFWDGASQPLLDRVGGSRRSIVRGVMSDLRQCLSWFGSALVSTIHGKRGSAWRSLLGLSQRAGRIRTQLRMLAANPN